MRALDSKWKSPKILKNSTMSLVCLLMNLSKTRKKNHGMSLGKDQRNDATSNLAQGL
jgi:hypothetical protein